MLAALYILGAIIYTIFARGETQDWALDKDDEPEQQGQSSVINISRETTLGKLHEDDNKF